MSNIIFKAFIPELFLSVCILSQLVYSSILINNLKYNFPTIDKETLSQVFFFLGCILLLLLNLKIEAAVFNFVFLIDEGSRIVKLTFILICLSSLVCITKSFSLQKLNFFEFFNIFLISILALLLLINSYDLMASYLIIEIQALCFYILASFRRNSMFSSEAGLKYFISGSFISGIFLLGCSFVYGGLGTLRFDQISLLLSLSFLDNHFFIRYFILFGIALIVVSLLFKLTAAPFHFWSPDVYDGSPLSTTIIFSIIPKLMIFTFFFKFLMSLSLFFLNFKLFLFLVSIASIFFGTFFAIRKKKLKRMLIYSSIAQVGFLVAAVSMINLLGFSSFFYYLVVYAITSILIWSYITFLYYFQEKTQGFYKKEIYTLFISNFSDLLKKNSVWSLAFILMFFSIAGMPPLSGFFSKFFVIFSVMDSFNVFESVFFIIISCVSVFYYLRILKIIFFEGNSNPQNRNQVLILDYDMSEAELTSLALGLFLLLFLFVFPNTLLLFGQYILLNTF